MQEGIEIGKYTIIDEPFYFGSGNWIGNYVHIRPEVEIGDRSEIRDYAFIGIGVKIGRNSRIYQYCNIGAWSKIGDDCFIGVGTVFANDKGLEWPDQSDFHPNPPTVQDRVRIGMKAIILPGVILAEGCRIGAGAVVVKSTEPGRTYVGNPARILK